MHRTRALSAIAVGIAAVLPIAGCSSGGSGGGAGGGLSGTVTIGVALPTTGGSAVLGAPMLQGINMAVKKINASGELGKATLKVTNVDSGDTDDAALSAFNRLASDHPAAIIGFPVSTQGFAVATQVTRSGIPVIMGGTNSKLSAASDWIFDMTSTDAITTTAAAEFAAKKLHVTKLGLLHESGDLGTGAEQVLKSVAAKDGFTIVSDQAFQTGDVDLSTQANALKRSGAQMIFVYGQQADYIVVANAFATAGLKLPTFIAGLQPDTYSKLNQAGFQTIYNRNQCVPSAAASGALAEWTSAYKEAYGSAPTEYAAVAYDGMNLLADAIKTAGSTDATAIKNALQALPKTTGICGVHQGDASRNLSYGVMIGHYDNGAYKVDEQLTETP